MNNPILSAACSSRGRKSILLLTASLALCSAQSAQAANQAWSTNTPGPANGNFSGINWKTGATTGVATPTNAAATGDALFFNTSAITTLNNDLSSATFAGFTFNSGASAYTIGGNAFTLGGNITNNSTNLQTFNNAITTTTNYTVTTKTGGGNVTLAGDISGSGGKFTLAGAGTTWGTLTLSGNNSFTGGLDTSNHGVIRLTNSNAAGTGGILIGNYTSTDTARLELSGGITVGNTVTLGGRTGTAIGILNVTGNNALTGALNNQTGGGSNNIQSDAGLLTLGTAGANWNSTVTNRSFTFSGAGNIAVVGNIRTSGVTVTKTGAGTLTFSGTGANSYTGLTSVNDGELDLGKTGVLAVVGNLTVGDNVGAANSAILKLLSSNQIATTSAVILNSDGRIALNSFANTVASLTSAGGNITSTTAGGNLTSTAAPAFSGIGNTIGVGATVTSSISATLAASGTLAVNGTLASGLDVATGATLSGSGTISGVTTFSDGTLTPGTAGAAGTLTTAALTFNAGSILSFDLGLDTATSDRVDVTSGNLSFAGSTTLNLNNLGTIGVSGGTYTLFSVAGTTSGIGNIAVSALDGYSSAISQSGNNVILTLTTAAIPEPSTCVALAGGLALVGACFGRRRKTANIAA